MAATATRTRSRPARRQQAAAAQARAQRSGGPEDRALYRCSCGHAFKAPVTTSVPCPKCGTGQAW
jgi:hypothetical protein